MANYKIKLNMLSSDKARELYDELIESAQIVRYPLKLEAEMGITAYLEGEGDPEDNELGIIPALKEIPAGDAYLIGAEEENGGEYLIIEVEDAPSEKLAKSKHADWNAVKKAANEKAESVGKDKAWVDHKIKLMKAGKMTPTLALSAIENWTGREDACFQPVPFFEPGNGKKTSVMSQLQICFLTKKAVDLSSHKGTGKDTLVSAWCDINDLPLYMYQGTKDTTSEDVLGKLIPDLSVKERLTEDRASAYMALMKSDEDFPTWAANNPESAELAIEYRIAKDMIGQLALKREISDIRLWAGEKGQGGGAFFINESNMIPPNVLALLHSVTDHNRTIPAADGNGRTRIPDNAILFLASNPGYEGAFKKINAATNSRLWHLTKEDLPYSKDLTDIVKAFLGNEGYEITKSMLSSINQVYKDLIKLSETPRFSDSCVNIRGMLAATLAAVSCPDISLKDALQHTVIDGIQDDAEKAAAENILDEDLG